MSRAATMPGSHERRETHDLIGSDKVDGTNVYRSNGDKIGTIERIMIDKYSGQVAYAVMSFGGFLGIDYNKKLGGFEVNITDQELENAPKFQPGADDEWSGADKGREIYAYYRVTPYWM